MDVIWFVNFSLSTLAGGWEEPHPKFGWGVPHPRSGQDVSDPRSGWGVPHPRSGWGGYSIPGPDRGGTPCQVWMRGAPHPADGGYPIQDQDRGTPHPRLGTPSKTGWGNSFQSRTGWGTPLMQDWMGYHPPSPSANRALATRRAVCLLRSRRRTFFFVLNFWRT